MKLKETMRVFLVALTVLSAAQPAAAQQATQCFQIECFYDASLIDVEKFQAALEQFARERGGITLYYRDVHGSEAARKRMATIAAHYRLAEMKLPALYGLNTVAEDVQTKQTAHAHLRQMLRMTVYHRESCPHCQATRAFLSRYGSRYPALEIVYQEVITDEAARRELEEVIRRYQQQAASLPVIHYCNTLMVGFDSEATTGRQIIKLLDYWSTACPVKKKLTERARPPLKRVLAGTVLPVVWTVGREAAGEEPNPGEPPPPVVPPDIPPPPAPGDDLPPLPGGELSGTEETGDAPLPPELEGSDDDTTQTPLAEDEVELPLFGVVKARELGMPLFTIAIGLVDGFNPCAMWVLLFLLSLLVNLHSRAKMFAIAGIFVFISGVAYYAFMAAWLNVFLLLPYHRAVEIVLGLLAIGIGSIHIKDFFAFHKGLTLSIPESARPGIYARARNIVLAETTWAAIVGVVVLAVLVNVVELLCTAGLPALYTKVLTMQEYPAWKNYAYLGLYNLAYMFDDGLMVMIAVATLGKRKLQEKQGRWLKLLSGLMILILGGLMLFAPQWLI